MPSVMTIEGAQTCKYVIGKGQYGKRQFKGCFSSKTAANKAAKRRGRGWRVIHSRPPGVPMSGLGSPRATHMQQMRRSIQKGRAHLMVARRAARARNCENVWRQLMIARANTSDAFAHLSSLMTVPKQDESNYYRLSQEMLDMENSIGWQCIRK